VVTRGKVALRKAKEAKENIGKARPMPSRSDGFHARIIKKKGSKTAVTTGTFDLESNFPFPLRQLFFKRNRGKQKVLPQL